MLVRLANEDWGQMTAAANRSSNHVKSMDRWRREAREANPALSDAQVERLAQYLRSEHYRRLGKLSAQRRRIVRDAVPARTADA